jgi:hypothetical protein
MPFGFGSNINQTPTNEKLRGYYDSLPQNSINAFEKTHVHNAQDVKMSFEVQNHSRSKSKVSEISQNKLELRK